MLSRIAESLYWLGRYAERAEGTARILDVHYHLLLEDRLVDEEAACRSLMGVMGVPASDVPVTDSEALTALLAFDRAYPGSIVSSLGAAWDTARSMRGVVSSEMWECLNAMHVALPYEISAARGQMPYRFFRWVKERAALLAGLSDSTLSRDDGWHLLVLGRSLERVDMTARLLAARYDQSWGQGGWVATLRSCSAYEAYLRTYQRAVDGSLAVEFLVLDRLFPRSVYHALISAEGCLAALDPRSERSGVSDTARRCLGLARAELEFSSGARLLDELPERLSRIQELCSQAGAAVSERYFRPAQVLEWSV